MGDTKMIILCTNLDRLLLDVENASVLFTGFS